MDVLRLLKYISDMKFTASYIELYQSGELERRAAAADKMMQECTICPRKCEVDRRISYKGYCLSGHLPIVSSYASHHGEEPGISGTHGAGNIFFGNCNLRCIYCQNYEISQNWKKEIKNEVSCEQLAEIMIKLQKQGCHNIGLVSPTHFAPQIITAIFIAAGRGLKLPLIYNSNGYDSIETLKMFDGIIDIYLPDIKYGINSYGIEYSKSPHYFETACEAVKEMYRQTGSRLVYVEDVIVRGLIIRHLILPNGLSGTEEVLRFISGNLSKDVHISLMSQYFPAYKAESEPLLSRTISYQEYQKALDLLDKYGLHSGWHQEMESSKTYRPYFNENRENPFIKESLLP
jgi:putative pyruvate formate lyase activating enzyme